LSRLFGACEQPILLADADADADADGADGVFDRVIVNSRDYGLKNR